MRELAAALLDLNWSDMDAFARRIMEIATDENGDLNDERYIAQCLIDWAEEIKTDGDV